MAQPRDAEEQRINRIFGSYLYIFPSLLVFTGIVRTLYTAYRSHHLPRTDPESRTPNRRVYPPSALSNLFSRYIKYPALFGNRHSQPIGWYTFPTRLEALLVGVYWFINISFLFVKHGNADDGIDGSKILADRAGVLSLWNMPIFFLLAGRNDFLVWLTGWSYGTFHVFHKWVARVSALMGMVHSVAYAVYMYQIGDEARRWNPAYWWNGVSAMIVMGLILVLAIFPFRKKAYEFFLITHIIGVMVFLIFLYHHLKLSATRMYNPWLWACIAMWAFDRFTRLLRILILNYGAFSRNPQNHHLARAKFVKGTNVIQLTVYPSAEDVNYFPGAHYFVFLTGTWRFWESHPFTAAAWRPSGPMMPAYNSADIHKIKRSLSGSLKNSLKEPRLPPRVRTADLKKEMGHLTTVKELGPFKEIGELKELTAPKAKRQEKAIYLVKRPGQGVVIMADNVKPQTPAPQERKKSVKRSASQRSKSSSRKPHRSGSKSSRDGSKLSRDGSKSSRDGSKISRDGSKSSRDGSKISRDGSRRSRKDSEGGTDRGTESEKSSENGKFSQSETLAVSNGHGSGGGTADGSHRGGERSDEDFPEEEKTVFGSESEKTAAQVTVTSSQFEDDDEEEDYPVVIRQGVPSTIASTVRKGKQRPKLTFFIKPRKGMTATLAERIREHERQNATKGFARGRELEIKCLIEGAYGVNHPLHLYETVVLIAGGVGITTILPYLCDYMERARGSERKTMTQRLVFLWTAKEEELVENLVSKRFPRGCLTRRDISMQLYVTKTKQGQNKFLPGVKYMRPDIGEILRAEQARLVGKMSILSCGPSVLVDIVRTAVVDCLDKDRKHIEYFEESY